jgi:hypothetical protein
MNEMADLALSKKTQKTCSNMPPSMVSNSWSVTMLADTMPRYVVTKIPIMGSSTASFKFAPDGTMTESNVAVTDDTAKTLLALFPITAKLSKQWDVNVTDAEAKSAETARYAKKSAPPGVRALQKPRLSLVVKLETLISYSGTLYTLRKLHRLPEGSPLDEYLKLKGQSAPLTLGQAMTGTDGVQLVSAAPQGGDSGKPEKSPAWQIQGTVTPPPQKTDDAAGQR